MIGKELQQINTINNRKYGIWTMIILIVEMIQLY